MSISNVNRQWILCAEKNTERIAVTRWTEVKIDERRNAGSLRGNRERYVPH